MDHEWPLVGCRLVADLPSVFACIPPAWFHDEETHTIWRAFNAGCVGVDALRWAKAVLGYRSLRIVSKAILGSLVWNQRWHAANVWANHQRFLSIAAAARYEQVLENGGFPDVPTVWTCWEAAAIDSADPAAAAQALLDERRAGEAWTEDSQLIWLLGARIRARS